MEFKKAVKTKSKLRLAIDGVSGSGKTFTALAIASGMGEKIALIDSEHGSASLYADRFDFDTLDLMSFQVEDYIEALNAAAAAGYSVVIIDSTSHAWDALVERVERIASQKFAGNTLRAWGEGTPLQRKLLEAMLNYPGHVIVTCRSRAEYSVDKNDKGKTTVTKVGTAAVQRQGFEYEFTMAMTMDAKHLGLITKDRTGKFQDQFIEKPGKEFGQQLIAWLNEGAAPPPLPPKTTEQQCQEAMIEIRNILASTSEGGEKLFTDEEYNAVRNKLVSFPKNPPENRLALINKLLDEQKALLLKRLDFFDAVNTEQPGPPAPAQSDTPQVPAKAGLPPEAEKPPVTPPSGETPAVPSMYEEPEGENTAETADDGFKDDIPWDEKNPPKTGGKKGKPESLSEGFRRRIQEQETVKAHGTAPAEAGTELNIF